MSTLIVVVNQKVVLCIGKIGTKETIIGYIIGQPVSFRLIGVLGSLTIYKMHLRDVKVND